MTDERDLERWPGYAEQSWKERFEELDREHDAAMSSALRAISKAREEAFEEAAKVAEGCGIYHFGEGPAEIPMVNAHIAAAIRSRLQEKPPCV